MIGVMANPADHGVVREFFELFKTPWELYRPDRRYEVVLCAGEDHLGDVRADLVLVYGGDEVAFDADAKTPVESRRTSTMLSYKGRRIPIYGSCLTFRSERLSLTDEASQQPAAVVLPSGDTVRVRIGYDLFREIGTVLTVGQPPANADIPVVEMHIELLRDLVIEYAAPLVEIPPVPDGCRFIACLTHDVDHPSIRRHRLDHTMVGFLYRALVGSLLDVFAGRASARRLLTNWAAAARLPLVHLGLAKDFWWDFDRYLELEAGLGSTFFVIPFEGDPGRTARGRAPGRRASRYGARDIADRITRLASAGCEIGVHGIDAWRDSSKGRDELHEIARITGSASVGVRMHWLYADEHSPATLEKAGFAYDSTSGYNGTVGYRAGTTQVFKPLDAIRLLELPLHVMDTALFYPAHLHCSPAEARQRLRGIIDNALRFGGAVTVNWHDRSLAPERLWGGCYVELLDDLKRAGAWFATASQAVAWFVTRRAVVFDAGGSLRATAPVDADDHVPDLRLRIHRVREPRRFSGTATEAARGPVDVAVRDTLDACVPI